MMNVGRVIAFDAQGDRPMPRVRFVAPAQLTDGDWEHWQRLADRADGSSVFAEPWFMRAALAEAPDAARLSLAIVEEGTRWLGVLPLRPAMTLGRIPLPHWAVWRDANQFIGTPLVAAGGEHRFWQTLLDALDRLPDARMALCLSMIPEASAAAQALVAHAGSGRRLTMLARGDRPALIAASTSDASETAACSGRRAARLRSQWRAFTNKHQVALRVLQPHDEIGPWIDAFLWLEALGWKGRERSALASHASSTALFRKAMRAAHAAGRLRFFMHHVDGVPVAMSSFLVAGTRAFGFKAAYDERYARYAPGLQLLRAIGTHIDDMRPLIFDSCAPVGPSVIGEFWKDRVAVADMAVALGRGGPLLAAVTRAASGWHAVKIRAASRLPT